MASSRVKRWIRFIAAAGAVSGLALAAVGVGSERYFRSDPAACRMCHTMQTPMRLWAEGEHREVACQSCHTIDDVGGLRMLWGVVRGASPDPAHARVDPAACARCHFDGTYRWRDAAQSPGHRGHAAEKDISCLACHATSIHKVRPTVDACATCHPKMAVQAAGMREVHCLACHNFRTTSEKLTPQRPDCLRCHLSEDVQEDRFPVGAPMAFRCSACHEPHRAGDDAGRSCVGCHAPERQAPVHQRHAKVEGGCLACHKPHAWKTSPGLCASCHPRGADPEHDKGKACASCHGFDPPDRPPRSQETR